MPDSQAPHISLKRDAKGRIAEKTLSLGGMPETRRYAYDSAGRLAQVTDERGALLESYAYDHQARRMADIRSESQVGERRFSYGHGDRLASAGNAQYSHDRAGFRNLKVEGTPGLGGAETWYHYEPSGLLLAVDIPGGSRIEYAYDANGLRREKRLNGRLVAAYDWLDPLRLSEFFDGREWWRFAYTEGRTPVGVTNGRDSFLLLADQLGTPLALATPDGRIVQRMRYDSFGNLLESRGVVVDLPLGFAGGLFDQDTGLTRFVWRDYDAETGRFTALDPLREKGGDADFYGYCVDDPVNRVDVWGLEGEEAKSKKPYYCWLTGECDEQGRITGDYNPIGGKADKEPFVIDFSYPLPDILAGPFRKKDQEEVRVPLGVDFTSPFRWYYDEKSGKNK